MILYECARRISDVSHIYNCIHAIWKLHTIILSLAESCGRNITMLCVLPLVYEYTAYSFIHVWRTYDATETAKTNRLHFGRFSIQIREFTIAILHITLHTYIEWNKQSIRMVCTGRGSMQCAMNSRRSFNSTFVYTVTFKNISATHIYAFIILIELTSFFHINRIENTHREMLSPVTADSARMRIIRHLRMKFCSK